MLDRAPRFDAARASAVAREHFGHDVTARPLPSERDQNFLLETLGGERFVLKIANGAELAAVLDAQQRAMAHLASSGLPVPRPVPSRGGALTIDVADADGATHQAWLVSWLPGAPLGTARHRSQTLLEAFGRSTGAVDRALATFDHPAAHREFYWDLARARQMVELHLPHVRDAEMRGAIDVLVARFDRHTASLLSALRTSIVHGDLNDFNVLVNDDGGPAGRFQRLTGIVDFGDMVHSYTVADLAIAGAYALLDQPDPLAALAAMARGYHAEYPLGDTEVAALFGLTALRLCASVCIGAWQLAQRPGDAYLAISQQPIGRTLPRLAAIPFPLAEAVLREAVGLEPVARSARVTRWLGSRTAGFAPVLAIDPRREPCIVLDLSIASPLIDGDDGRNAEPYLTTRVWRAMTDASVKLAIGRYDEPRLLYTSPAFAAADGAPDERRTIHIGLDLFAEAGTPVYAPIAGTVHAFADNASPQDYGPVIVLRHEMGDGEPFFTLYGHLSRESLHGLTVGMAVAPGQRIATLGAPSVNGGWSPHLHLQVVVDLLDLDCDFPGVARAAQRAVWRSLCPDPNLIVGVPADRFPPRAPELADTMAARRQRLGRNLSVAYREPVRAVRGWRQFLFDADGRRYLDAYNNVPHVGHCHPRVVQAGQAQMAVLNTNTRYPSDLLNEYARRLSETLPSGLDVCFFVNSASEANELALRLARTHTRHRDMIVLEAAYHGNTNALIDLSPYKHAGPGGAGAPDWVHVAPLPDDYRGPFKRGNPDAGRAYASHIEDIIARAHARGRTLAGFIAETCPSVGGQIVFPAGYLEHAYQYVRAAGGVCIADEVQTGLGRMGTHFWAFEAQGVVPDIVVMGKPLGNGHPIGAVVTTRAIADAFDNGMEYFSTFGGSTVSCAIGLAVLDVVRDEGLQAHALHVGQRMLDALRPLVDRCAVVGDVRGSGLFLGVELVQDRDTLAPAADDASYVVNRMREAGVLLGTDGPYHNVVKIRPPMPFDAHDADRLTSLFASIVAEELRPGA